MVDGWRDDLEAWLKPFVGALRHKTRARMCPAYVAGLIGPGDRKSVQPMAARDDAVSYDQLHHFVASGVWDAAPLEAALLAEADRQVGGEDAWLIIDDTALPKKGRNSVGIAPQYAGALGKNANCQALVSLTLARREVPVMVGLRLFLPESWTSDPVRLDRAKVPEERCAYRTKPEIAFDEIDRVRGSGVRFGCVLADAGYGLSAPFRQGVERALDNAPRNIPDDLLTAIGRNGGVVMVNFYPSFVSQAWRDWDKARTSHARSVGASAAVYGPNATAPVLAWEATHPEPVVTSATIADHVDHIAKLAGKASVGIGSDYDGIDGTAPCDMTGVDGYPALFAELARRGWSDTDLAGLARGNILRVMEKVESVAKSMAGMQPIDATDRP